MYKIGLIVLQLLCFIVAFILIILLALSTVCCLIIHTIAAGWSTSDDVLTFMEKTMRRRLK